jgi:2-keto-4-pentenoate hydratase/2-oxohepta-3-ene-1,7-dioic acid hydratase in catechol pathway
MQPSPRAARMLADHRAARLQARLRREAGQRQRVEASAPATEEARAGSPELIADALFSKFANALAGQREPIPLPPTAERHDYEAELDVLIGRRARCLPKAEAPSYILGYRNANDLSAHDL